MGTEHSGGGLGAQQVWGGGRQGGFSVFTDGGQIRRDESRSLKSPGQRHEVRDLVS